MALGTALSDAATVSTTAGVHNISFNSDGIAAVNAVIGSGVLTVCLMSYHIDYLNNAPVQDGDYTQIFVSYMESGLGSLRPDLKITFGGITVSVDAENSGNGDDAYNNKFDLSGSVAWDDIRGDSTTAANSRRADSSSFFLGVYSRIYTGRGGAIKQNVRSVFAFDLSSVAGTATAVTLDLSLDNLGSTNDDFGKVIAVQSTALEGTTADYGNCFVADEAAVTHNATFFGANF